MSFRSVGRSSVLHQKRGIVSSFYGILILIGNANCPDDMAAPSPGENGNKNEWTATSSLERLRMLVSFLKTPNQYGDWMERMFWLTSALDRRVNEFPGYRQSTPAEGVRALERKFGITQEEITALFNTATRSSDTSFAALAKLIEGNQLCKKLTQPSQAS